VRPDVRPQALDLPVKITQNGVSMQSARQQAQAAMQKVLHKALRL
jgi:hypothetical protein